MRFTMVLPLDLTKIEEIVMKDERTIKQLDGKTPNKVIIVQENNQFGIVKGINFNGNYNVNENNE
jgi:hypothetical protein